MGKLVFKKQDGFTVVELLTVLAILGIVLALGYMYFGFGVDTFARGERRSIAQQSIRLSADLITNELRYAEEVILDPANTAESGYYYIEQQGDSVILLDKTDENEVLERVLLDSEVDDIAYKVSFEEESAVERIDFNLVLLLTLEAEDGLYELDTKVYVLNLTDGDKYESGGGGPTPVIKFRKPSLE